MRRRTFLAAGVTALTAPVPAAHPALVQALLPGVLATPTTGRPRRTGSTYVPPPFAGC